MNRFLTVTFLLFAIILKATGGSPSLPHVWKFIYAQEHEIEKSGDKTNQLKIQRQCLASASMQTLNATPANQLEDVFGKLSAAMYFVGENGSMSDVPILLPFAEIQLPSSWPGVGDIPVTPGPPPAPASDIEKRRVPACYALSKILMRSPDRVTNLVADSATNETLSATATLRILGVLIDVDSIMAPGYAELIRNRFKSKQVNEVIADLETRKTRYWMVNLELNKVTSTNAPARDGKIGK